MLQSIRIPAMALAASGLALAMPASAAPAAHIEQQAYAASYDVMSDSVAEHGRKHRKHWKRGRGHHHEARHHRDRYRSRDRVVYVQPRRYAPRPYYMGYARDYGQPVYRNTRIWRGNDDRYYCRKDDGTTGLLVGAGVGALIGHEVAGRGGDRTLGAIIGGAAGALLGRSIDRSSTRCG